MTKVVRKPQEPTIFMVLLISRIKGKKRKVLCHPRSGENGKVSRPQPSSSSSPLTLPPKKSPYACLTQNPSLTHIPFHEFPLPIQSSSSFSKLMAHWAHSFALPDAKDSHEGQQPPSKEYRKEISTTYHSVKKA